MSFTERPAASFARPSYTARRWRGWTFSVAESGRGMSRPLRGSWRGARTATAVASASGKVDFPDTPTIPVVPARPGETGSAREPSVGGVEAVGDDLGDRQRGRR